MNHGEQWTVPFNRLLIVFALVLWAVWLPWWTTLIIALPIGLLLGSVVGNRYGGMQVVMLIAPAFLAATMGLVATFRDADPSSTRPGAGELFISFLGTMITWMAVVVAVMAATIGIRIAREWAETPRTATTGSPDAQSSDPGYDQTNTDRST